MSREKPLNLLTLKNTTIKSFIESFDTVIVSIDGVIWTQTHTIDNSQESITSFRQIGKKLFFLANTSSKTREEIVGRAHNEGFDLLKEEMLTSPYLAAEYLKEIRFEKKIFVIGSEGLLKELASAGFEYVGYGPGPFINSSLNIHTDPLVGAVLIGLDQHLSYQKLLSASAYLSNPAILFLACNSDDSVSFNETLKVPGAGCIVKALERCTQRTAHIIGKPNRFAADFLMKNYKLDAEKTLVIGDGLNTDILFGTRCGFQTLLVLTGVTKLEDVEKLLKSKTKEDKDLIPDFYIESIGHLVNILNL
ncbi:glycerol-3-phosphate phosphatase-like isoform X2 [Onthophagus taurus]|uniref:glycerol-3-phosphate phosphatase-like isoform X2 n=1 Tax=Onthophagus taurus TaxID=166361 RepID=UPI0039BE1635